MSDAPFWSTPATRPPQPPPRRGLSVATVAIMALVVGAIGGGAAGGYVASTRQAPAGDATTTAATSTAVPGPLPTAPPVIVAGGATWTALATGETPEEPLWARALVAVQEHSLILLRRD